jgi:siroheme synthase-like protein
VKLLPVALNVQGRRCLVVGGGAVARRKAQSLVECGAHVVVIAPHFEGDWPDVEKIERRFQFGDCTGAALIFACTNDASVNEQIAEEAQNFNIWCNVADDASVSDFHSMAILRRGEISVAVATGGGSPALARHLKERISETIGAEYETLLEILAARRGRVSMEAQSERAEFWRAILSGPVLDLLREGKRAEAETWIDEKLPGD